MEARAELQKTILLKFLFLAFLPSADTGSWDVTLPRQITALKDSCLVIPCVFGYPGNAAETAMTAVWMKSQGGIFFHSRDSSQSDEASRDRTVLVGKLGENNCSLLIKDIMESDAGQLTFRIEIDTIDKYSFLGSPVTISVEANPPDVELSGYRGEIKEGESMTMECKTTHTCNWHLPAIVWTPQYGTVNVEQKDLGDARWEITSRHIFSASHNHNKKVMTCKVQHGGGRESRNKTPPFNVLYAPRNTTTSISGVNTDVQEGSQVSVTCSSDSNPPISSYAWNVLLDNDKHSLLNETGSALTIRNVTRMSHSYYCTAINNIGAQSSTVLLLNILYAPEILPESKCQFKFSQFECSCVVQSNPPSSITWLLTDRKVSTTEAALRYSSSVTGHVTNSHLDGTAWLGTSIICSARNNEGTALLVISNQIDVISLLLAAAVPVGILVLVFTLVACWYRRTKSRRQPDTTNKEMNQAKQSRRPIPEPELDSTSDDDYVNVTIIEKTKYKKILMSHEEQHPGGPYQMDWSSRDEENIYTNC